MQRDVVIVTVSGAPKTGKTRLIDLFSKAFVNADYQVVPEKTLVVFEERMLSAKDTK